MNVYALVHARILGALAALQSEGALAGGLDFSNVEVAPPRDPAHGDLASNAALVLAKAARMKPRDIAEKLGREAARRCRHRQGRGGGAGLPQPELPAGSSGTPSLPPS